MMVNVFSLLYLFTVVVANLAFSHFMQSDDINQLLFIDGIISFFMIGFDMAIRDKLHDAWEHQGLFFKMPVLILAGSIVSFLVNYSTLNEPSTEALKVPSASFLAFMTAGFVDFSIYHLLRQHAHWMRVNGSNLFSAAVDSFVFSFIAFGFPMQWNFFSVEFTAKVIGGVLWFTMIGVLWKKSFSVNRSLFK